MFLESGARKKKSLTDPVEIIPFPDQNLRGKAQKATTKPVAKPAVKKVMDKPAPKVLKAPSGQLNTSNLSIKKMLEKKQASDNPSVRDLSNMPRNDYSYDEFKMIWRRFANKMKEENESTIYNAMIKRDAKIVSENNFLLEVDNQVQIDKFQVISSDIVDFLRINLKNYFIELKVELSNNPEEEVQYKSGKDKFAALARKNPNLHTLKNTFNLDIEF